MTDIWYTHMPSPVGRLLLACSDAGLKCISFPDGKGARQPEAGWQADGSPLREVIHQLEEYFSGRLRRFDLVLEPEGSPFQRTVWKALCDIPYGATASYGEIAHRVGKPKAVRAVGGANGRNPIPIVIPCHRVIGSNGRLTGYGGGLPVKEFLLAMERRNCEARAGSMRPPKS